MHSLAAASRPSLSETEPKWSIFETSRYAFGGRNLRLAKLKVVNKINILLYRIHSRSFLCNRPKVLYSRSSNSFDTVVALTNVSYSCSPVSLDTVVSLSNVSYSCSIVSTDTVLALSNVLYSCSIVSTDTVLALSNVLYSCSIMS